jgi:hypothetical protein
MIRTVLREVSLFEYGDLAVYGWLIVLLDILLICLLIIFY